jgi:hypothetical protein
MAIASIFFLLLFGLTGIVWGSSKERTASKFGSVGLGLFSWAAAGIVAYLEYFHGLVIPLLQVCCAAVATATVAVAVAVTTHAKRHHCRASVRVALSSRSASRAARWPSSRRAASSTSCCPSRASAALRRAWVAAYW